MAPVRTPPRDHQAFIRRLKAASIVVTTVALTAFGVLVTSHQAGAKAATPQALPSDGSTSAGPSPVQSAGPVDPFFDPNPGSVPARGAQPIFGGGGPAPAFQSSGS